MCVYITLCMPPIISSSGSFSYSSLSSIISYSASAAGISACLAFHPNRRALMLQWPVPEMTSHRNDDQKSEPRWPPTTINHFPGAIRQMHALLRCANLRVGRTAGRTGERLLHGSTAPSVIYEHPTYTQWIGSVALSHLWVHSIVMSWVVIF